MTPEMSSHRSVGDSLDQQVEIETPEQVAFSYTIAGVGSRAAAAIVDHIYIVLASVTIWIVFSVIARVFTPGSGAGPLERATGSWVAALILLLVTAIQWGYYVLFEGLWDGQTPGKRRMGLRVVQDGGYSVSFAASAVRNLARVLDAQPGLFYGVGIVSAAISNSGKRLGDHLAGTIVVQEKIVRLVVDAHGQAGSRAAAHTAALTEQEFALLERFIARRATLDVARRRAITEQLAERFRDRLPLDSVQDLARLTHLYEQERSARSSGIAAKGDTGAAREHYAIVARGVERWSAFAKLVAEAQSRGLRGMSEREVSEFVAQYREVAADLARLKTASRGRGIDALFHTSRLVGAGHNLLYRQKPLALKAVLTYMAVTVPREIRRSAAAILAAAGLLFLPMLISYGMVLSRPHIAEELLPPEMIDRAEEGVTRLRSEGKGYIDVKDFERPVLAGSVIANNVQVTFGVFASGLTAGILTVAMLVYNGIAIGATIGLYANKGIARLILEFVAPHGVLELSAIAIAGGGALLIARAILLPGALTRREAMVIQGRRAIRLVAAATFLLLVAGAIEGLISPRVDWPVEAKWGVSLLTAILLGVYVSSGRGSAAAADSEEFAYRDDRALMAR